MIAPPGKVRRLTGRAAVSVRGIPRFLRLHWRRLLPKRWRQRPAAQATIAPAASDRTKELIAWGVWMAEFEAIWQLRQRAMRHVMEQPMPPLEAPVARDSAAQIMAEFEALRERRRQAADDIERRVRQAARDSESEAP
jgi:hypothetical protein